jgi:pimeloyl-ACP methyl ester carboxylesterase
MRRTGILFGALSLLCALTATDAGARQAAIPDTPPAGRFDPASAPPAPDYAGPTHWASLPWTRDDGDMTPHGVAEGQQLRAPVDVFFIHSAVPLRRPVWNADPRDVWYNGDVGQTTIRNQASAFNGCCAIYAPRYRQMNPAADDSAALELAYSDIARAFAEFRRRVGDRPFILAGHGQGAQLGQMLIARAIDGQPIAARMVAAYLPGHAIALDWVKARRSVRLCAAATDTGCVATWSSWAEGSKRSRGRTAIACTNPISWSEAPALPAQHRGAWMRNGLALPEPLRAPEPGLIGARCGKDGRLYVSSPGKPYSEFAKSDGDTRALDIQLVWMDLRENAVGRVAAFLAAQR